MQRFIILMFLICPWITGVYMFPRTGLYFRLGNKIYLPRQTVNIADIGEQPYIRSDPGSTLVCITSNVNRQCCRRSDGGNIGEWYFPNNTLIPRVNGCDNRELCRAGFTHEVRLSRFSDNFGPTGVYHCRVPDPSGILVNASIKIAYQKHEANISLTYSDNTVTVGGVVSINCSAKNEVFGNNLSIALYMPNMEEITDDTLGVTVHRSDQWTSVIIHTVQFSHAGEYTCTINGTVSSEVIGKEFFVKVKPPEALSFSPPNQPVYATTTRNISFFVLLRNAPKIPYFLNMFWTSPTRSRQKIESVHVNVTGKTSYSGSVSLKSLGVLDTGNYTCSLILSSPGTIFLESNSIDEMVFLKVRAIPKITVSINTDILPQENQSYSLICSYVVSDLIFSDQSRYVWRHNGIIMNSRNSPFLSFSSLSLQDVGNYTCEVSVYFGPINGDLHGTSDPYPIILQAPCLASVELQISASSVFAGKSAELTCLTILTIYENIDFIVTMELKGPNRTWVEQAVKNSSTHYIYIFTITSITFDLAGKYSCSAVAGGPFFLECPPSSSNSIELYVVGSPPSPTIISATSFDTSIYFNWSIPQTEILEYFEINYGYIIRDCYNSSNGTIIVQNISTRSYTLDGLEENSDVSIILSSVNQAGRNSTTLSTFTLPSAPARAPTVTATCSSTSINLTWKPIPCSERNANITGYKVSFMSDLGGEVYEVTTKELKYKATGLIPRENYTFHLFPIYNALLDENVKSSISKVTTVSGDLGFFLNGSLLSNNSMIRTDDIGIEDSGLFCLTNLKNCCVSSFTHAAKGSWRYPNQTIVPSRNHFHVYQTDYASSIILEFHKDHLVKPFGVYTCKIPDLTNIIQNLYIYIGESFHDLLVDVLEYNRSSLVVTCISSGRPVNSIQWYKDGQVIDKQDSQYNTSQELVEGTSSSYEHTLSSKKENLEGRFTCRVQDIYTNSNSKTIMINNCSPGQYGAVAFDGSTVCISCPTNSMSTSEGSQECGCLLGYYRSPLEDSHFPCTRPPSKCQNLKIEKDVAATENVKLVWNRPQIIGRNDLYYNIYLSNPDHSGELEKVNSCPIMSDFATLDYSLSKLRPLTNYTVRVSVHNGVSELDPSEESKRMCEITWTTPDEGCSSNC